MFIFIIKGIKRKFYVIATVLDKKLKRQTMWQIAFKKIKL